VRQEKNRQSLRVRSAGFFLATLLHHYTGAEFAPSLLVHRFNAHIQAGKGNAQKRLGGRT
jgi:hypothetical protein